MTMNAYVEMERTSNYGTVADVLETFAHSCRTADWYPVVTVSSRWTEGWDWYRPCDGLDLRSRRARWWAYLEAFVLPVPDRPRRPVARPARRPARWRPPSCRERPMPRRWRRRNERRVSR